MLAATHLELPSVAYFCMEIGLGDPNIPTYSGGLGVLAGDTLRSAADLQLPMVGVTLLYRKGYFRQRLDPNGRQMEESESWEPQQFLELMPPVITMQIEGRQLQVRSWRYEIQGITGHTVPVYFLDTVVEGNSLEDQALSGQLYGGDPRFRLRQETLLGLGGVAMLRELGHDRVRVYHMNEGHSALLALALLEVRLAGRGMASVRDSDVHAVRRQCVFTTHTPVPAGMDRYPWVLAKQVLGEQRTAVLESTGCCHENTLNMTYLALRFSRYINGVAMRHGEVSRDMFPRYPVNSITNGVHAASWTSPSFAALYDRHIPEWRYDNLYLRYAVSIPFSEIQGAHTQAKLQLLDLVKHRCGRKLDPAIMTMGFARRATPYKRADLVFTEIDRLRSISKTFGGLQIIFGGKAHPADRGGKELIHRIFEAAAALGDAVTVVYLENYDIEVARHLVAGVDLWLNTPLRPNEASGTSGMKAALNGVPSLSVLDGWWIEGHVEGKTGWAIGSEDEQVGDISSEATDLYDKLEHVILPLFTGESSGYTEVRRSCIALNASFFNTQRMVHQYVTNAYMRGVHKTEFPAIR